MKRAGIYVRVSTEKQAEKASPEAQERECREYCQNHGYQVIEVYRDIERYRSGRKMVEPSGTRSDRPQFLRMLADADEGKIDMIIAWREDRLYRNVNKAMLEISDRVTKNKIGLELVKEFYDPSTAIVKAWAAGIELKAKHDRFMMGITGRLRDGKEWLPRKPFGYWSDHGTMKIREDEAKWVRLIFKWYGEGLPLREIRDRLINAGAPQRMEQKNKHVWAIPEIRHVLKYEPYYTGNTIIWWDDVSYDCKIPIIIDDATAKAVLKRRGEFDRYPAGNLKAQTLAAGLIFCKHCNTRLNVVIRHYGKKTYKYYRCPTICRLGKSPGECVLSIHIDEADEEIWSRVWKVIEKPEEFNRAVEARILELQSQEVDASYECERLEKQLSEVVFERQKVITWARKKIITESDLAVQLSGLDQQAAEIENNLRDARLLVGNHGDKLKELGNLYTAEVRAGMEEITANPQTPGQEKRQLEFRKRVINAIVTRVEVDRNKAIKVYTDWNLPQLCEGIPSNNFCLSQPFDQK